MHQQRHNMHFFAAFKVSREKLKISNMAICRLFFQGGHNFMGWGMAKDTSQKTAKKRFFLSKKLLFFGLQWKASALFFPSPGNQITRSEIVSIII
jgi:hypothetical protein